MVALRVVLVGALFLAGCATRPVNPQITHVEEAQGYRFVTRQARAAESNKDSLVVLAFSGGGTRAAAFSYGVLETLRRTEVVGPKGNKVRLLDEVDIITGVSGGSFTALAYGLYGDKLFDDYPARFLKRDVQGTLVGRLLDPQNWGTLWWSTWGRSELAAQYYDEILFNGATFADLNRGNGPFIMATATDLGTGSRLVFSQANFDFLCSDVGAVKLSRAAASSSAVPLVMSPVTFNNYGGTCNFSIPEWLRVVADPPVRPAARAIQRMGEMESYGDPGRRFVHLVDGGVSDNLGVRGVLEAMEEMEALRSIGRATPLDRVKRVVIVVVNSLSSPKIHWEATEQPPGAFDILLRSTGVPIDRYSFEQVELLRDIAARWETLRRVKASPAFDAKKDPSVAEAISVPASKVYIIDVSFSALKDESEREYLNQLPTSFVLPADSVDRLRAAAGTALLASPEFRRLLNDVGATLVPPAKSP